MLSAQPVTNGEHTRGGRVLFYYMNKIFSSASKIVFIMMTITACAGFLLKYLPVDQFMILAIACFGYYFSKPAPIPDNTTSTIVTGETTSEK